MVGSSQVLYLLYLAEENKVFYAKDCAFSSWLACLTRATKDSYCTLHLCGLAVGREAKTTPRD